MTICDEIAHDADLPCLTKIIPEYPSKVQRYKCQAIGLDVIRRVPF